MLEKIFNKKLTQSISKAANSGLPFEFANFEKMYLGYVEQVSKTDFANAPTRYISEAQYLDNVIKLANKYNLQEQVGAYSAKKAEVLQKLEGFGITFK